MEKEVIDNEKTEVKELDAEKKENPVKPLKESVYDQIPLTVKQLDIILVVLAIAFVIFFVIGALKGNGLM